MAKEQLYKTIDVPIYKFHIQVFQGSHKDAGARIAKAYGDESLPQDFKSTEAATFYIRKQSSGEVSLGLFIKNRPNNEVVAHEAVHLAYIILDHVGVEHDVTNHEALAYLVGYLTQEIHKLGKQVRKR